MLMEQIIIKEIIGKHGRSKDNLLPILQEIVQQQNYLTEQDMIKVANELEISAAEVYGTASFYTFLPTQKRGRYVIKLCKSIIAKMKGFDEVLVAITEQLGIQAGETTFDGRFSLELVNDIGWSDQEPSMLINDKAYTNLTPTKVSAIISDYLRAEGNKPFVKPYLNN